MKKYTYVDYAKNREKIFECEAEGILVADKMLFEATGIRAEKNSNIGCESKDTLVNDAPKMM